MYSHALIFSGDHQSKEKAADYSAEDVNLALVEAFVPKNKCGFRLEDFPIFSHRLESAIREMNEWRPQNLWQLFKKPYNDTLAFYGFWFAFVFGIISLAILGVASAQLWISILQLRNS
jgi:hypothetical protein